MTACDTTHLETFYDFEFSNDLTILYDTEQRRAREMIQSKDPTAGFSIHDPSSTDQLYTRSMHNKT